MLNNQVIPSAFFKARETFLRLQEDILFSFSVFLLKYVAAFHVLIRVVDSAAAGAVC